MPKSYDETAQTRATESREASGGEPDVIDLVDEVKPEDELAALTSEMPEFKMPTGVNSSDTTGADANADEGALRDTIQLETDDPPKKAVPGAAIVSRRGVPRAARPRKQTEEREEVVYDRQELVKTMQLEAIDRSQFEATPRLVDLSSAAKLTEQAFAPDIVVAPPRVLIKRWTEGTPLSKGIIEQVEEAPEVEVELEEIEAVPLAKPPPRPSKPTPILTPTPRAQAPAPERRRQTPRAAPAPKATKEAKPAEQTEPRGGEMQSLVQDLLNENDPAPPQKPKQWFEKNFTQEYLRTLPRDIHRQTLREVQFIEQSLRLNTKMRVLDLACGFGRHSIELTRRGFEVVGLDLSMPLLQSALAEAKKQSLSIKFIHGDMRKMTFEGVFDACFAWQTSFGYFDDRTNLSVLRGIYRALVPGGRFVVDVINRDHVVHDMPHRIWWEGHRCVFLEEVDFDHGTSMLHAKRSFIYQDGTPPLEQKSFIRLYSLHELRQLFRAAGFEPREVSGELHHRGKYLGPASSRLILMGQKPLEN